jgi:general nucleoside transport system permease protein
MSVVDVPTTTGAVTGGTTRAGSSGSSRGAGRVRRGLPVVGLYIVSVAVALALCALLVSVTGGSAPKVFSALLDGSLRSPGAWGLTITTAVPLLIVAVGTIVATKAGLVNIGQEGQLLLGAAAAAYVATRLDAPGPVVLTCALVAGAIAGGLWAALAALTKFTRQVPEVISTLLLAFIASQIGAFLLTKKSLLLSRARVQNNTNAGQPLPAYARMPTIKLFGNSVSWGVLLALVLTALVAVVLARTTAGFKLRMLGMNPRTARRAGVSAVTYGGAAIVVSGAFAGVAGGAWLTGGAAGDRFNAGISSNIGWQGLLVALLARDKPLAALPMAFVFAALRTGSGFLSATGVERRIADVVQAMLVLALLVPPAVQAIQRRRSPKEAVA